MANKEDRTILSRQRFFDKLVYHPKWQESLSGKNEEDVIKVLDSLGYKIGVDYVRQYPIGEKFVMDFAFVKLRICIEVDGSNHLSKASKKLDRKRDNYMYTNGWVVIRINDRDFFDTFKKSFYKNLIRDVVEERTKQWNGGFLFPIDIPNYVDQDFEGFR